MRRTTFRPCLLLAAAGDQIAKHSGARLRRMADASLLPGFQLRPKILP